jgi:hypothetical protein
VREQWLRRLLKHPLLLATAVMEPFAREALAKAARNGQTVLPALDQTDLGDRMALLVVALRVGDRALPLVWQAEAGPANIGFEGQRRLLEQVRAWLPAGAKVLLSADRFYPSAALFGWVQTHGWGYRLRLKGNVLADTGQGDETATGQLAQGVTERYLSGVRLFTQERMTNLGIPRSRVSRTLDHRDGLPSVAGVGAGLCRALGHRAHVLRLQGPGVRPGELTALPRGPPGAVSPGHGAGDVLVRPRRPGRRPGASDAARKK